MNDEGITRIGPLVIGRPYQKDDQPNDWSRPIDSLSQFLNVNTKNDDEVLNYCKKFKYIPSDCTNSWAKGFENDQKELRQLVTYYLDNSEQLNDAEVLLNIVKQINAHIEGSSTVFKVINRAKLTQLDLDTDRVVDFGEHCIIKLQKASSSLAQLWLDLADAIISSQRLKNCNGCGKYFMTSGTKHNQEYCPGKECGAAIRAKNYRERKKASRQPSRDL